MERKFVILGAAFMAMGVAAGAFGSHGLSSYFASHPDLESTYDTAVRYHLIHGLALLAIAWAASRWPGRLTTWSGYLLAAGIFLFSGSLYLLVLIDQSWLGAVTPLGGAAFIAGWLLLLVAAWKE